MRCITAVFSFIALSVALSANAGTIPGRIVMGTSDTATDGFPRFFDSSSGFTQGDTSHTHSVSFDDGIGKVDYTLTIEAFDAAGAPAGLNVGVGSTGVELGVDDLRIDTGESIKVTYDDISYTQLVPGAIVPMSFDTILNAIHFNSFGAGDTYTYSGVGAGSATGDDTFELLFGVSIATGDTFTITGDSGAFKLQWLSHQTNYTAVPEPSSVLLVVFGLTAAASRRRND